MSQINIAITPKDEFDKVELSRLLAEYQLSKGQQVTPLPTFIKREFLIPMAQMIKEDKQEGIDISKIMTPKDIKEQ